MHDDASWARPYLPAQYAAHAWLNSPNSSFASSPILFVAMPSLGWARSGFVGKSSEPFGAIKPRQLSWE